MNVAFIREAKPGDESGIHEAHMRSIREVCVKDHTEEEIRGWGNRPLGDRWVQAIRDGHVWVVELEGIIRGLAYIRILENKDAHLFGLYLAPEVVGQGFGKKLADLMLSKARTAGVKAITLDSTLTGHGFYQRLGFVDSGPMQTHEIGGSMVRGFPMILHF